MARVLDVAEFVKDHTSSRVDRRTDVFLSWIDKSPSFCMYYSIDKNLTTSELGTLTIDEYYGPASPIVFNKIKDFPVYGISQYTTETEYDEEDGLKTDFTGEAIILPNTIIPCEGDAFYVMGLPFKALMVVNEVREVALIGRTHYTISFHAIRVAKLNDIEKQVSKEYVSVYDNIGTELNVVYEESDFTKISIYTDLYKKFEAGYKDLFFDRKAGVFLTDIVESLSGKDSKFIDKFLIKFMEDSKTIIFDGLTKSSFTVDTNNLEGKLDMFEYSKTLFYNLHNKRSNIKNVISNNSIELYELHSPLSLYKRRGLPERIFFSNKYINIEDYPETEIPYHTSCDMSNLVKFINDEPVPPDPDIPVDPETPPGPTTLLAGTMQAGFFGEVDATELFTSIELANLCKITSGLPQFNDTKWLKFAWKGEILYVAKKPMRYFVSYENINNVGAADGTKIVYKRNVPYQVMLMEGALSNPSKSSDVDRGALGSMWNELMLPIHEQAVLKNYNEPKYVDIDNIREWPHMYGNGQNGLYNNEDLVLEQIYGNGSYTWCVETTENNIDHRVIRGGTSIEKSNWASKWISYAYSGWRPVLKFKGIVP